MGSSPFLESSSQSLDSLIFILEDRTAAGTKWVGMASRTRNKQPDRTQRGLLMEMLAVKDQKPKLPRESRVS